MHRIITFSASFLLLTFTPTAAIMNAFKTCDHIENIESEKIYELISPGKDKYYPRGAQCRWEYRAPEDHVIDLNCDTLSIPWSPECKFGRLEVSRTGDPSLVDRQSYCGKDGFKVESIENYMVIALRSSIISPGGFFKCSIRARATRDCNCGRKLMTRIVGGMETKANEYTPMAGIVNIAMRKIFCGATIVNRRQIVSAAHCVIGREPTDIGIVVGEHDTNKGDDSNFTRIYLVDRYKIHENYVDDSNYQNDIALIQIIGSIDFNYGVSPVCLPYKFRTELFTGRTVEAAGWGTTSFSGPTSNVLMKVKLNITSNAYCNTFYSDNITQSNICTYWRGQDTCQMDSGGPLFYTDGNILFLVGIISSGIGCGGNAPGVSTRMTEYVYWIQDNLTADICIKI